MELHVCYFHWCLCFFSQTCLFHPYINLILNNLVNPLRYLKRFPIRLKRKMASPLLLITFGSFLLM